MPKEDPIPDELKVIKAGMKNLILQFSILIVGILAAFLVFSWELYRDKCKLEDILG